MHIVLEDCPICKTFANSFRVKHDFTNYIRDTCWFASDQNSTMRYFPVDASTGNISTQFSFDSKRTWVIVVLGLFFEKLSIGVCTTRHWRTSGRLVQESNVGTVPPV